jgi:hypothetical protein
MSTQPASKPTRTPQQQAARTANVWGWSFIATILGAFGAGSVPPGPLRVLVLNLGILCFVIGVLELVWRHYLLKTGEARWVKILALNQVGGTLSLLWSLYLLYEVPDQLLMDYSKKSDMWKSFLPLLNSLDTTHMMNDAFILHYWHVTKIIGVYGLGGVLMLSQIWVIYHYLSMARAIEQIPPPSAVPPILK